MIIKLSSIAAPTVLIAGLTNLLSGLIELGFALVVVASILLNLWMLGIINSVIKKKQSFLSSEETFEFFMVLGFELLFSTFLTLYYLATNNIELDLAWIYYASGSYGVGFLMLYVSIKGYAVRKHSS